MSSQNSDFQPKLPPEIVHVGRQPILDRNQQIYGYELLYRSETGGPDTNLDGNYATAQTILTSFIEFGMQRLVGSHRVFINLTRTFFTNIDSMPFDKDRVVIEVLEDIEFDQEVIAGVRSLHENGYVVALDDYKFEARWEPVLPYCSIIKVDITDLYLDHYAPMIDELKSRGLILLAEKVETREVFEQVKHLGFDLFQGYFFAKPQILSTNKLQTNQMLLLKLISRINDPQTDIDELAELVSKDAKLSYKILRFINSSAIGLPKQVESIKKAVLYIGLERLRAWANLLVMAGMNNKVPEILTASLIRAEFCKMLAKEECKLSDPDSCYTIGLFSMLDALLNQPMSELVNDLPLPSEMLRALTEHTGPYSVGLNCIIAIENGQWSKVEEFSLNKEKLNSIYFDAITKAEEINEIMS